MQLRPWSPIMEGVIGRAAGEAGLSCCKRCRRWVAGKPGDVKVCSEQLGIICQRCAKAELSRRYVMRFGMAFIAD